MDEGLTTLPQVLDRYLVRFLLPGLNLVLFVVVIPAIVMYPDDKLFAAFSNGGAIVLLVLAAFVVGFMLDGLKVYQLSLPGGPKYKHERDSFFDELNRLHGDGSHGPFKGEELLRDFLLKAPAKVAKKYDSYKEQWILSVHTSWILLMGMVVWVGAGALEALGWIPLKWPTWPVILEVHFASILAAGGLVLYMTLAWQLREVAQQQRLSLNRFINFQMQLKKTSQSQGRASS